MHPAPGVSVAEPVWTGSGRVVQLRASGSVHALRAIFVNGRPRTGARTAAQRREPDHAADDPDARRLGREREPAPRDPAVRASVRMVFVHHTATTNDYSEADVPAILRSIYAYHVQANGWNDIGYNYLVDRFGQIWEGRYGGITQQRGRRPDARLQHRQRRHRLHRRRRQHGADGRGSRRRSSR